MSRTCQQFLFVDIGDCRVQGGPDGISARTRWRLLRGADWAPGLRWLLFYGREECWHNWPHDSDGSANGAHLIRGLAHRSRSPRHVAAWTISVVEGDRHTGTTCCILYRGSGSLLVLSGSELGSNDAYEC